MADALQPCAELRTQLRTEPQQDAGVMANGLRPSAEWPTGFRTEPRTEARTEAGPERPPEGQPELRQKAPKPARLTVKSPKAASAADCSELEQLPNIGPAMAADLRALGIRHPRELAHRDAFVLYQALCAHTGKRQDPCVLDTFMAATDFMRGAAPAPWWTYTAQRKLLYGTV